jgi:cardiolipin synthase
MGAGEQDGNAGGEYSEPDTFAVDAQGQRLKFFPGGAGRLGELLALIEGARESLRICFYIFAEDETGVRVRDALTAAAVRGVSVRIMLDGFGAKAGAAFFAPLCDAGGSYCCFSPRWSQRYLIRNHQKIVIADETKAMIGGFNVADDYFARPADDGWSDLGVTVEGSAVAMLSDWFDELEKWTAEPNGNWRTVRRMVREWRPPEGPVRLLVGGPTRTLSGWARCVGRDLERGKRLDMVMAYFSPPSRLLRRIGRISRRGEARLVLAAKSDNAATIGATRSLYDYLLTRRAKVFEFLPAKLHTKLIVIDDVSYFGSANFDMRSLFLNLEIMLRIDDAALAARLRRFIDEQSDSSRAITPQLHKRRATPWNRLRWNLSWFLVSVVDYTVTRRLNLGL